MTLLLLQHLGFGRHHLRVVLEQGPEDTKERRFAVGPDAVQDEQDVVSNDARETVADRPLQKRDECLVARRDRVEERQPQGAPGVRVVAYARPLGQQILSGRPARAAPARRTAASIDSSYARIRFPDSIPIS